MNKNGEKGPVSFPITSSTVSNHLDPSFFRGERALKFYRRNDEHESFQ